MSCKNIIRIICGICLFLLLASYVAPKTLAQYWGLNGKMEQIQSIHISDFSNVDRREVQIHESDKILEFYTRLQTTSCKHVFWPDSNNEQPTYTIYIAFKDKDDFYILINDTSVLFIHPDRDTLYFLEPGKLAKDIETLLT